MVLVYRDSGVKSVNNGQKLEQIDEETVAEYRRQIEEKNIKIY